LAVVVNHNHQVALPFAKRDVIDANPAQARQAILPLEE
jgi:hypothetical protein